MIPGTLIPTAVKKGQVLGVIAPAGQMHDLERFRKGVQIIKEMGFELKFPRDLWPGKHYLADSDENRAAEINAFFKDDEVAGLISLRGGYGCLRLLDKLDLTLISKKPKLLVGFSDITILQNHLFNAIGLVSLHGPVLTSLCDVTNDSLGRLYQAMTGNWQRSIAGSSLEILRDGPEETGPIIGGNLASLITLLGTEYDNSWEGKIVFLEDTNEPLYKIDRMLTQLHLAGKFNGIKGLILGDFSITSNLDELEKLRYKEAIWYRVLELLEKENIAIWANFPCGHCEVNLTLPFGWSATMDHKSKKLRFD